MLTPATLSPVALTMGDPAGIGPDITLKAWARRQQLALPPFLVIGSIEILRSRAKWLGLDVQVVGVTDPTEAVERFSEALPVLPLDMPEVRPGTPDPAAAPAIIAAIETAVRWTREGRASAMVTNPIAKSLLFEAGFAHPGHTEFLATLAAEPGAPPPRAVMMLAAPELKAVPVTVHIPLAEVPATLTSDLIVETGRIVARDLATRFAVPAPRLVVAGLNPHAGERGTIGTEDVAIIAPAVSRLRGLGIDITGPWSADSLFHAEARSRYDAVLAMYHDQALIPIKTLAFDHAVNVTLGLPFIRTSPDHGTAFDIAGTMAARETSLVEAIRLADRLAAAEARLAAAEAAHGV